MYTFIILSILAATVFGVVSWINGNSSSATRSDHFRDNDENAQLLNQLNQQNINMQMQQSIEQNTNMQMQQAVEQSMHTAESAGTEAISEMRIDL